MKIDFEKKADKKIQAAIFDFDGLLVDNEELFLSVWNEILSVYGKKMSLQDYSNIRGKDPAESSKLVIEKYKLGDSPDDILRKRNMLLKTRIKKGYKIRILPGARECLVKLTKNKYPLALASNSYREYIQIELEKINCNKFFDHVLCREDVNIGKPSPEIYLKASSLLNIPPNNCLVFEDSAIGAMAAEKAGMNVVIIEESGGLKFEDNINISHYLSFIEFLGSYNNYFE